MLFTRCLLSMEFLSVVEMEAELKRLQREVAVLRQERDILKKAMSIVSRSQP